MSEKFTDTPTAGLWECNRCGLVENVVNGYCPACGPTQTTPANRDAQLVAGSVVAEEVVEEVVE
jgi:hypothetical protein